MPLHPIGSPPAAALPAAVHGNRNQAAPQGGRNDAARTMAEGDRVSLSPAGLRQAGAAARGENRDIDDSGLPDTLKELLKMTRKLKAQLQERSAALQRLMADGRLTAEERSLQAQQLQTEIGALSGALATVMKQFAKAMKEADLSREQAAKVAELLAA